MLAKDRFLKKIKFILLFVVIAFQCNGGFSKNIIAELVEYNTNLKNSTALFIQTDGTTIQEGNVYIGEDRIKIDYEKPTKISIVLAQKKGMYINHELREVDFFPTKDGMTNIFFKVLLDNSFFEESVIVSKKNSVNVSKQYSFGDSVFDINVIYENNPILLRKIIFRENNYILEVGFFDHLTNKDFRKGFFSLISPYNTN